MVAIKTWMELSHSTRPGCFNDLTNLDDSYLSPETVLCSWRDMFASGAARLAVAPASVHAEVRSKSEEIKMFKTRVHLSSLFMCIIT